MLPHAKCSRSILVWSSINSPDFGLSRTKNLRAELEWYEKHLAIFNSHTTKNRVLCGGPTGSPICLPGVK